MSNCSQCGSPIPDDQRLCSRCYGDIDYGHDGHYQRWAEQQEAERQRVEEDIDMPAAPREKETR